MKKLGGVSEKFLSDESFDTAEKMARKGKDTKRQDIKEFLRTYHTEELRLEALRKLSNAIRNKTFVSSKVSIKERFEGEKWRKICTVPFYPDRITQFAIYNVIKERCAKVFIKDMYSYDKGVHELSFNLRKVIRQWGNKPLHILKFDITKFYDSIDINILIKQLEGLIKDKVVLWAIKEMLYSHGRVFIGMLLSTLFSGLYLSPLDRFVKETLGVKHYFRFADDFIILHEDKDFLKDASWRIKNFLYYTLNLSVNYSLIFNIEKRPLDFCGYVHYKTHSRIRKKIKKKFVKNRHNPKSVASYMGMLKWCDSKHLIHVVLNLNNYAKERSNIGR